MLRELIHCAVSSQGPLDSKAGRLEAGRSELSSLVLESGLSSCSGVGSELEAELVSG